MKPNATIRTITLVILAALMLLMLCACNKEPQNMQPIPTSSPAVENPTTIKLVDMIGREVELEGVAKRIVALTASDCEIIYTLGAGESIVGRGEYCNYPAEILEITSVQSGTETNLEQIISLAPDCIIISVIDLMGDQLEAFNRIGIPVIVTDADTIEGTYTAIELLGKITGKDTEAKTMTDGMKSLMASLAGIAGNGEKTVYFEVSPLEFGLWTAGKTTFMDEAATHLGLKNIFGDLEAWAEISPEQVIERNPDYIVTIAMYFGEGPTPDAEIMSRSGWESISAIKNSKVLHLANDELSRPSPRLAEGVRILAEFVTEE